MEVCGFFAVLVLNLLMSFVNLGRGSRDDFDGDFVYQLYSFLACGVTDCQRIGIKESSCSWD